MSDDLLRRFRDKIRGRPARRRGGNGAAGHDGDEAPPDSIRVVQLQHGPFPEASRFNDRFIPGLDRVRVTLAIGSELRGRRPPLSPGDQAVLLGLCPRLPEHRCAGGLGIHETMGRAPATPGPGPGAPPAAKADAENGDDGLALAHLIEHVAIDLILTASRTTRCSGATCAHADRLDLFDLFLECPDPGLGRAAAVLAAAAVRDLCAGRDRLDLHRRCRDLLACLTPGSQPHIVAEDAALLLGWKRESAFETLQALARLGYLEPVPAAFTFSSATGVTFRRSRPEDWLAAPHRPGPPAAPSR